MSAKIILEAAHRARNLTAGSEATRRIIDFGCWFESVLDVPEGES